MESEGWVEEEIERQLQRISLEDTEADAEDHVSQENASPQPVGEGAVSPLFHGYLAALYSQQQNVESLFSEAQGTLTTADQTLLLKTEDLFTKHFDSVWGEEAQETLGTKEQVLAKLELEFLEPHEDVQPHSYHLETASVASGDGAKFCETDNPVRGTGTGQSGNTYTGGNSGVTSVEYSNTEPQVLPTSPLATSEAVEVSADQKIDSQQVTLNSNEDITKPDLQQAVLTQEQVEQRPDLQTVLTHEQRPDLQAVLTQLEEEQKEWEEELAREQREREAAIDAMIRERERARREQERLLAERAALQQQKRVRAVVVLQSHWRGHRVRSLFGPLLEEKWERRREEEREREREALRTRRERSMAATVLQAYWRGHRTRRQCAPELTRRRGERLLRWEQQNAAARAVQAVWRGQRTRRQFGPKLKERMKQRALEAELKRREKRQSVAALAIQTAWRGFRCRIEARKRRELRLSLEDTFQKPLSPVASGDTSHGEMVPLLPTTHSKEDTPPDPKHTLQTGHTAKLHDNPEVQSPTKLGGKFTVSMRIQSSLKLLQQSSAQDLVGSGEGNVGVLGEERGKGRSASVPETGTGMKFSGMGMGLESGIGTQLRGLKESDRNMLIQELERIQHEEQTRSLHQRSWVSSYPPELPQGGVLHCLSLPPSPVKRTHSDTTATRIKSEQAPTTESKSADDQPQPQTIPRTISPCQDTRDSRESASFTTETRQDNSSTTSGIPVQHEAGQREETKRGQQSSPDKQIPRGRLTPTPSSVKTTDKSQTLKTNASVGGEEEGSCSESLEDQIAKEQQAMNALVESREREQLVAQLSRERMSQIISTEELAQVAVVRRSKSTYKQELEYAATPLSPQAWMGVVEERHTEWKESHTPWKEPLFHNSSSKQQPSKPPRFPLRPKSSKRLKPLSKAQLLAASPKGTKLDEVTQVIVYHSHSPIDLHCLSQCPELRCLSLTKCGLSSLASLSDCPSLTELTVQSSGIEHTDCTGLTNLRFLDLGDNRLTSIQGLHDCHSLVELNLAENRIARVADLSDCPQLQKLVLDGNLLISCRGIQDLPLLQFLSFPENHLPRLEGIGRSLLLQVLRANQNNLQEPPALRNHVLLRELRLDENSLSNITPITHSWLPLLQTLTLTNNCITELDPLTSLLALESLDISNNSLYDFPCLLQSLRACFALRNLVIQGNPVTEEPRFRSYLLKALPSLDNLDEQEVRRSKSCVKVPEVISSYGIYQLCRRQIAEQDEMKGKQEQEIELLLQSDDSSPGTVAALLEYRVSHCHDYQDLLIKHLREHESFEVRKTKAHSTSTKTSKVRTDVVKVAATLIQAVWRGWRVRSQLRQQRLSATRIQAVWRGYSIRTWLERATQLHWAATVIQAQFRGYRLRRRLREVLDRARYASDDDADQFDYEEEIQLDYLDEGLLEGDLKPLSPREIPLGFESQFPETESKPGRVTVPVYVLPGVVGEEISLEQWRMQEKANSLSKRHPSHQRKLHIDSDPPISPGYETPFERQSLLQSPHPIEPTHIQPRAQLAWSSVTQFPEPSDRSSTPVSYPVDTIPSVVREHHVHGVVDVERSDEVSQFSRPAEDKSNSNAEGGWKDRSADGRSRKEQIASDWGFKSSLTAELMLKRAQRQRRLQANATRRKKLADPAERLALFRKTEGTGRVAEIKPRTQRAGHAKCFHTHSSTKSSPSPDPEEARTKNEFLYQWVHSQRLEYEERGGQGRGGQGRGGQGRGEVQELRLGTGTRRQAKASKKQWSQVPSSDCSLPRLEPHVLAGHTPRLVTSEVQNQLVDVGCHEDHRPSLRASSLHSHENKASAFGHAGSHSYPFMKTENT